MRSAADREMLVMTGTVIAQHRGDFYEVECTLGALRRTVLAKRSGRLFEHNIRLVIGDVVEVEVSPYDMARGRITHRGPKKERA